jgi:N-acetylneuraminate lyase
VTETSVRLTAELPTAGLMAATFTPMRDDGSLNLEVVGAVVDHLLNDGIVGLYVCGTTGEGHALTVVERRLVAEAYIEASDGRLPVIVHVGHNSLHEARGLAEHAREVGATAISAMLPWHSAARDVETVVDSIAIIASGAPDLPFIFYHLPNNNEAAVKFTDSRTHILQSFLDIADGRLSVYFGVDEMLANGLFAGADVAIGSTYNFAAPLYRRIVDAVNNGDVKSARTEQTKAVRMIRMILSHGGLAAQKEMMGILGVDCGPTRLPHRALTAEQKRNLRVGLDELGFSGWIR